MSESWTNLFAWLLMSDSWTSLFIWTLIFVVIVVVPVLPKLIRNRVFLRGFFDLAALASTGGPAYPSVWRAGGEQRRRALASFASANGFKLTAPSRPGYAAAYSAFAPFEYNVLVGPVPVHLDRGADALAATRLLRGRGAGGPRDTSRPAGRRRVAPGDAPTPRAGAGG